MGPTKFRRVVTGHDENGRSKVLIDGPPQVFGGMMELWLTDQVPADNRGVADAADRPVRMPPPKGGTRFHFNLLPGEDPDAPPVDPAVEVERMRARYAEIGGHDVIVDTSRHPRMHRTNTVDYIIVLSGRLRMILDEGEVDLEPYDTVVQRGTNHAWVNLGKEPVLLLSVNVDADPL